MGEIYPSPSPVMVMVMATTPAMTTSTIPPMATGVSVATPLAEVKIDDKSGRQISWVVSKPSRIINWGAGATVAIHRQRSPVLVVIDD